MNWLWWTLTGLGGLGIVGLIVAAIFAPAALAVVWKLAARLMLWLVETRIGVGLVVGLATFYATSIYQHRIDVEACRTQKAAMVEAARAEAKARDASIDARTTVYVNEQLKLEARDAAADAIKESAYVKTLSADRACPVGDDVDRLRDLAGLPPLRSERGNHKTVPASKTGTQDSRH